MTQAKKIAMILAFENFRDEEFDIPYQLFKKAGFLVDTVSTELGEAKGKYGMTQTIEKTIEEISEDAYDAVVFIGGSGVKDLWNLPAAQSLAKRFASQQKWTCAICSAPVILARAGLLTNRYATSYIGDQAEMEKEGVRFTGDPITIDIPFITANGPDAAAPFGDTLIQQLKQYYGS